MQPEEDADALAQDVVNARGHVVTAGHAGDLSTDFKVLFDKVEMYRSAKRVADNRRQFNMLTLDVEEHERITRKEFLEAHRAYHKKHR
jgi:hypothetical protein